MTAAKSMLERVDSAILVDEIGIETGQYDPYTLKTTYRTIFRRSDDGILPWGVVAGVQLIHDGKPVSRSNFLDVVPLEDRIFVRCLSAVLQIQNYRNIFNDELVLLWDYERYLLGEMEGPDAQISLLIHLLAKAEIDSSQFVCRLPVDEEGNALATLVEALHRNNIGIAVDDFGTPTASASRIQQIDPNVVTLDGDWFRRIVEEPTAVSLLGALVGALRREGRKVLIEGIESPDHLRAALITGADLLEGSMLRPPFVAGVFFDAEPLNAEELFSACGSIASAL